MAIDWNHSENGSGIDHNLTDTEIKELQKLADAGKIGEAWSLLAKLGDGYAGAASQVMSNNPTLIGQYYKDMVSKVWEVYGGVNIANSGVFKEPPETGIPGDVFMMMSQKHLRNYILKTSARLKKIFYFSDIEKYLRRIWSVFG